MPALLIFISREYPFIIFMLCPEGLFFELAIHDNIFIQLSKDELYWKILLKMSIISPENEISIYKYKISHLNLHFYNN